MEFQRDSAQCNRASDPRYVARLSPTYSATIKHDDVAKLSEVVTATRAYLQQPQSQRSLNDIADHLTCSLLYIEPPPETPSLQCTAESTFRVREYSGLSVSASVQDLHANASATSMTSLSSGAGGSQIHKPASFEITGNLCSRLPIVREELEVQLQNPQFLCAYFVRDDVEHAARVELPLYLTEHMNRGVLKAPIRITGLPAPPFELKVFAKLRSVASVRSGVQPLASWRGELISGCPITINF